ncbi:hypothetical protein BpHYR1_022107 [Brachionus plicatilis]|uniref:Uncharacterized protein n=1 Tax=Brachionus plicatilis TaxID=10195 RepID=A0A3M7SR20_BRAPC|nr:hypothetical protein BpHYR1_022107 [Brachionus plicatilis]
MALPSPFAASVVIAVAATSSTAISAVARKVSSFAALVASQIRVHPVAASIASLPSVHIFDGLFGIALVLECHECIAGRVASQPHFSHIAKFFKGFLDFSLRAVRSQIGHMYPVALLFISVPGSTFRA